mgnify:CR=1 FL=1
MAIEFGLVSFSSSLILFLSASSPSKTCFTSSAVEVLLPIKLKDVCSDDIVGLRNKLLLQLGYETMRRRSEICQFKFEDLQHFGNHKHALLLRHSKTDHYNQGKIIPISGELSELISSWSLAIDQDRGYILRSFKRNHSTKSSLTPASINHILKSLQKQAGLNQI